MREVEVLEIDISRVLLERVNKKLKHITLFGAVENKRLTGILVNSEPLGGKQSATKMVNSEPSKW